MAASPSMLGLEELFPSRYTAPELIVASRGGAAVLGASPGFQHHAGSRLAVDEAFVLDVERPAGFLRIAGELAATHGAHAEKPLQVHGGRIGRYAGHQAGVQPAGAHRLPGFDEGQVAGGRCAADHEAFAVDAEQFTQYAHVVGVEELEAVAWGERLAARKVGASLPMEDRMPVPVMPVSIGARAIILHSPSCIPCRVS